MKKITASQIQKAVRSVAKDAFERAKEEEKLEDINDIVFEEVDSWWSNNLSGGRIDDLPAYPGSTTDINLLINAATVMQATNDGGWGIESDSGMWEGVAEKSPWAAVVIQAYHSFESAVNQEAYELVKKAKGE